MKKVNQELIATIEESIQIVQQGHRKRAEAEIAMQQMEGELKQALVKAQEGGAALPPSESG